MRELILNSPIESWPELKKVERPGRYLGGEVEAVPNQRPDEHGRMLRVALAFSDVYEIAHGHLGHKILYSLINQQSGLSAERVYAPWPDWEKVLREKGRILESLESRRALKDFDLVGFSLQYELGYTNILNMLEMGGLPLRAEDRDDSMPLVAAGGPGAYNPEPLAEFFDLFFLGDAEHSFVEDLAIIKEWRAERASKSELWERLAGRPGIYIPSLFRPHYGHDGRFSSIEALKSGYEKTRRAAVSSLDLSPFPLCQITPLIKPVHDRVVVEIGRGCSRGCRFCQAGYIYRPVRERRQETIMDLAGRNLASSGQDEVSFLSLSAGDHTQIAPMVSGFMDEYAAKTVALSLPSLRVKSMKSHLARQIRRVRKTGFTLAPEAGTQRLRDVINKDLTDDDLFVAAEEAFSLGWRTLKLYFMVGLPTETEEDFQGVAELTRRLKKMSRAQLNLGVAHFTPKAHTPFQWHAGSTAEEISRRLFLFRDTVRAPGLTPKWNAPGASWVESLLARGDRRLGRVLEKVYRGGARFEAWGDRFNPELWIEALAAENLDEKLFLTPYGEDEALPYDHIDAGVTRGFLKGELEKARRGETTTDCRWDKCHKCGACEKGVAIDLAQPEPAAPPEEAAELSGPAASPSDKSLPGAVFLINFRKEGRAAYLGHLELVELFKRAFRRAGLELAMSEGYHPQPKISFLTALPLGVSSDDEYLRVVTTSIMGAEEVASRLAEKLPVDITLKGARILPPHRSKIQPEAVTWKVTAPAPVFTPGPPLHPEAVLEYTDKKGRAQTHKLADFVTRAESDQTSALITIKLGLSGTPKPIPAAAALWGLNEDLTQFELFKIETILRGDS
ncbi:TIGR03960 family radical SAM protein [Deltaproteobacteria bacterium Smac51]|nr:TIGR03960 family radical SAM protein [Deltaproteobacteria bacterium Smac51]